MFIRPRHDINLQLVQSRLLRDDVQLLFLTGSVNVNATCLVELGFVLLIVICEELLDQDVQNFQLFEDYCDVQVFFQSFSAFLIQLLKLGTFSLTAKAGAVKDAIKKAWIPVFTEKLDRLPRADSSNPIFILWISNMFGKQTQYSTFLVRLLSI